MTSIDPARETYAAMIAPPPFVQLATSLLAASTRAEREAALRAVNVATREAALHYMAAPEATRERDRRLEWMRADPRRIAALRHYYASHIDDFVSDLGYTVDPRRIARGGRVLGGVAIEREDEAERIDALVAA